MISVIVPVYQAERFVERCIKSVINQTSQAWELLLIDDGSTDNSLEICEKFKEDSRIRIYHHDNKGVGYTRNRGISLATGNYILFLDSDDEIKCNTLETLERNVENTGRPDMVFFGYKTILKRKSLPEFDTIVPGGNKLYNREGFKEIFFEFYRCNLIHNIGTKAYRREIIKDIRFDENISNQEDALFCTCALQNSYNVLVLEESLYIYHINDNSESLNHLYRRGMALGSCRLFIAIMDYCGAKETNENAELFEGLFVETMKNELLVKGNVLARIESVIEVFTSDENVYGYMCEAFSQRALKLFDKNGIRWTYIRLCVMRMRDCLLKNNIYDVILDLLYPTYKRLKTRIG